MTMSKVYQPVGYAACRYVIPAGIFLLSDAYISTNITSLTGFHRPAKAPSIGRRHHNW
jgi:hypothetical protein